MCPNLFFFFKQKTAYEMRISDWSSDVCSSDLRAQIGNGLPLENGIDSRDGLHSELTGNEAIFIDIDFDQLHALIGIIRRDLFDNGSKLLAGAAPFRPEIDRKSTRLNSSH